MLPAVGRVQLTLWERGGLELARKRSPVPVNLWSPQQNFSHHERLLGCPCGREVTWSVAEVIAYPIERLSRTDRTVLEDSSRLDLMRKGN